MAQEVAWFVPATIDIRRNDTVDVTPADNKPKRDTTLVYTFDIVGSPGNCVRYRCWIGLSECKKPLFLLDGEDLR